MTAIGLGAIALVLLLAITDKNVGSHYSDWVKAFLGAVLVIGALLTIVGLLLWAWRTLP